jgi:hypothetical protein
VSKTLSGNGPYGYSRLQEKIIATPDSERFCAPTGRVKVTLHRYLHPREFYRVSVIGEKTTMLEYEGEYGKCLELYEAVQDGASWDSMQALGLVRG